MLQTAGYRFGLLGHPVAHSLSPIMHEASFRALQIEAQYLCFDVLPEALEQQLRTCHATGFDGLNVTVPHKIAVLKLMDALDDSARLYGAVNVVRFNGLNVTGFNTDADGFMEDLTLNGQFVPEGRTIMILGCGGAGRALAIACANRGAMRLLLAEQIVNKASELATEINAKLPQNTTQVEVLPPEPQIWQARCREAELVIQCTPLGLHPTDPPVLPAAAFTSGQLLYDLVYTQKITPSMATARAGGARVMNGLGMLVYQGAAAFKIWTGRTADIAAMRSALEEHIYQKKL